jgi:ABC-type Mn2+/Zn2+ transport system permease subunit
MDVLTSLTTAFNLPFMGRALLVLIALSIAAGLIGVLINLRGLEFVADGLTHAVFPGIAAGFIVAGNPGVLVGALIAAGAATIVLTLLSNNKISSDATTAIVLTAMFSIGVIIVSSSPSRSGGLEQLLFGHLLTLTDTTALITVVVAAIAALLVLLTLRRQIYRSFDEVSSVASGYNRVVTDLILNIAIALVIVAASTAIGNLLVLAILIVPGALARLVSTKLSVIFGVAIASGILASWLGLAAGFTLSVNQGVNMPGGATVALAFISFYAVALLINLVAKRVRTWAI